MACLACLALCLLAWLAPSGARAQDQGIVRDVAALAALGERSTGGPGARKAAAYIVSRLREMGFDDIGRQRYLVPRLIDNGSSLSDLDTGQSVPLHAFFANAVTPQTIAPEAVSGPLVWAGDGAAADLNGKPVPGAVLLMRLGSGSRWETAASLGAKAVIYVDEHPGGKGRFQEKHELNPVDFPSFYLSKSEADAAFPGYAAAPGGIVRGRVSLTSASRWVRAEGENIHCMIEGTDKKLNEQLLVIEAFYDSSAQVAGLAPGADEAGSIATLLSVAETLAKHPPKRSVLLVATSGHAQGLAGIRDFFWASRAKGKHLKDLERDENDRLKAAQAVIKALSGDAPLEGLDTAEVKPVRDALDIQVKNEVDRLTVELVGLRLAENPDAARINALSERRMRLRQLTGSTYGDLTPGQRELLQGLVPRTLADEQEVAADAKLQRDMLKTARSVRGLTVTKEICAVVSLHLSSHGDGVGAFNYGFFYDIRPDRNRNPAYSEMSRVLDKGVEAIRRDDPALAALYRDTLRPSQLRSWQSYFPDSPYLGGEVAALSGYLGLTLASTDDFRPWWGTPQDTPERVDMANLSAQAGLVSRLMRHLAETPDALFQAVPRQGLAELEGHARFIRQGELFPDQAAPGTLIQAYQGPAMVYAMTDTMGRFLLKGLCDKKNTFHKVILEGYRFDPETGRAVWAIDKRQTGKDAYRVKMNWMVMQTDLVMFAARQITALNLYEPRTFQFMTRINVYDGRRDSIPNHYWYSRVDTRESTVLSFFLEPQVPLKFTLSDSLTERKLILSNSSPEHPDGVGYLPEEWPLLPAAGYLAARDMWTLLAPRIENLETHGIFNERVRSLEREGRAALAEADKAWLEQRYDTFLEQGRKAWAMATRVYNDVEQTQKDVLVGVLFYIALFVPFAWCLERVVFGFSDIHRRIIGFLALLMAVIGVIYAVHPAFKLTYSPLVVILAFFIVGLSVMVSLIIFLRFEQEMQGLQRRSRHVRSAEIGHFKAFAAAFVIGVANLRRRRIRTFLTCATLVILTFTIMSFTAVKSVRLSHSVLFAPEAAYPGLLMRTTKWDSLPVEALNAVHTAFGTSGDVAARIWLDNSDRTQPVYVSLEAGDATDEARGMIGLGASEPSLTGLDKALVGGRWFAPGEADAVLLPENIARRLGIDPARPGGTPVRVWGMPLRVVGCFDGAAWDARTDLDGEPLTPVTFPSEAVAALTEAEAEAQEGGDLETMQSRYQHIPAGQIVVVPTRTALELGGSPKAMAVLPPAGTDMRNMARSAAERYGLSIFAGEPEGVFVSHAADTIDYSGVPNLLIPICIAALIVLNTMISSVYERKREIAVYTSVGMAPTHVAYLFVAEAVALAVISTVFGYLLAQTAAGLLSGTSIWAGMTANYSSLAGIAAMILVMVVTLLSVIYPAKVAADVAIPDVNRSWTMPVTDGNEIILTLPFLLKKPEQECVGGFLLDYYSAHQGVSHGLFCTDDVSCALACPAPLPGHEPEPITDDCLTLKSRVWLAPFDFGVKQRLELTFCPAREEPEFLEIRVRIIREAGEAGFWKRINKAFLNDIRKQLLIWRSLRPQDQAGYDVKLREALGQAPSVAATQDNGGFMETGPA